MEEGKSDQKERKIKSNSKADIEIKKIKQLKLD